MTAEKRESAKLLMDAGLSVTSACEAIGQSRASFYRQTKDWQLADSAVIDALNEVLEQSPRAGFWKCFHRLRRNGYAFNHKRVYRQLVFNLPRRKKQALPKRCPQPLDIVQKINHQWALDFMHDSFIAVNGFEHLM